MQGRKISIYVGERNLYTCRGEKSLYVQGREISALAWEMITLFLTE
jgi:hypothetical protein